MNALDFMSLFLLVALLSCWIYGGRLPDALPPERCYLVHLNASAPYHERNKQPTTENLKRIIPVLTSPYNLSDFTELTCNETAVTLKKVMFSSRRNQLLTKLDVWFKVEPHKNVAKLLAYYCAENMLYQGSQKVKEVERLLRLCKHSNNNSVPICYHIDQKSCCEEQHLYEEPCCRAGYTLKNLTCLKNKMKKDNEKGELMKMEKETGDDCKPTKLSVGIIIIIASACLIVFVSIVLAGARIFKYIHRPNRGRYNDVAEVINSDVEPEERRATGESSVCSAAAPVEGETKDGYMKMQNLSKTNLFIDHDTTQITANNTNNCTSTATTNNQESSQDSIKRTRVESFRPPSHSEMMFDFDKYVPIEAIDFTNKMLGRGQFGQVELAYVTIKGIRKKCAVKMIRGMGTHEDERELFDELQMLYQIPYHPNVVSLLGACFDDNSPLYVIVEYCANGSLLKYLQNNRATLYDYVNFSSTKMDFRWKLHRAMEICKGMIFLGQRQIIHRDLAARNILLDENEVAKISDFGMAKDVYLRGLYIKETAGFLPVRWMAIEAIESRIYTIKSDMWSFGILLWEMYMNGLIPYPGVTDGNDLLEKYLKKGFRMAQPENCPDSFYHLMERCWLAKPEDRPSFTQALRDLEIIKDEEMRRESEASKITEVSDTSDLPVFEEDSLQDTSKSTHTNQQERQENVQLKQPPHQEDTENDMAKTEDPIDIGIVNRGRSSIDSSTDVKLPSTSRKNSDEQTSHF